MSGVFLFDLSRDLRENSVSMVSTLATGVLD